MPSPRLGSGFLQLESRDMLSAASPDFTVMLDTLGVSAQVRTALLDIHDTNAPLATSLLETHTSLSALEHSVVSLSGSQTYNGIGSVPHTTAPHFAPFLTEGFSLSMDIKPTHNTYGAIVSKYDSSISDRAFHLAMDNTGRLVFTVYAPGLTRGIETSSPVLSLNTWQHVQVSFNPETQAMTITVNDTQAPTSTWASATIRTLTNGASPIRIGSDVGGNGSEGDAFFGEIKNVQLSALNTAPQEPLRTQRTALLSQLSALELDADLLDLTHGIQVDAPPSAPPLTLLDATHPFTGQGSAPAIAANHFLPFTKNFSLHAQINPTELAYGAIASKYESSIGDRAFHFALESDGKLTLYLYGQGLVRGIQTTAPIITTNAWQTVSASFKASTQAMEITVNGQVIPTTLLIDNTISELNHGPAALRIGSAVGGNGSESGFFPGQIRLASLTAFGEADPAVVEEEEQSANDAPALSAFAEDPESITPHIDIVSMDRSSLTLNIALPPTAEAIVTMDYILALTTVTAPGGTTGTQVTIELDPYVRHITDTYTLYIKANGQTLDALPIHWDAARQRFTIPSADRLALGFVDQSQADPLYDVAAPEQWESGVAWNPSTVMSQNSIAGLHPGSPISGGGQFSIDNDSSTFRRIDIAMLSGGNVTITGIKYFNETGVHTLPPAYYQIMSNKTVIIKPNAPTHIILQTSGSGSYYLEQRSEPSAYGLAPSEAMSMTIQTLQIRTSGNEGWGVYPTNLTTQNARGNAGSTVNMLFGVINQGLVGGDITAQIKVGDGSASDQVLKSFGARHFNPQEYASLAAEVTLPTNHAFIYLEVTLPDGRTFRQGRFVQEPRVEEGPREMTEVERNRLARINSRIAETLATSPDARITTVVRGGLNRTTVDRLPDGSYVLVINAYDAADIVGKDPELAEDLGIGGSDAHNPNAALLHTALSWYDPTHSVPGNLQNSVDSHGMVSRILLGAAQRLWSGQDQSQRQTIAANVEALTGVSASSLLAVSRATPNAFARGIQRSFENAHLDFIADGGLFAETGNIRVATDSAVYIGGSMNIRWDLADTGRQLHHVGVYVIDDATGEQLHHYPLSGEIQSRFFLNFPVNPIAKLGSPTVHLKVVAWFIDADGNPTDEGRLVGLTGRLLVKEGSETTNAFSDLSTLQKNDPNKAVENLILNQMQFPINGSVTNNFETSTAHHGDALYALDLSGGSGTDILAPAEGKIYQVDLFAGQLILEHKLATGEVWYTTLYHLTDILENISNVSYVGLDEALVTMDISDAYKQMISSKIVDRHNVQSDLDSLNLPPDVKTKVQTVIDAISTAQGQLEALVVQWKAAARTFSRDDGVLAKEGNEGASSGKHAHLQVNIGSIDGAPVNLFRWLDAKMHGIQTIAKIDGRTSSDTFVWDDSVGTLVNADQHIAILRDNRINANNKEESYNKAFAWEEGKRVEEMERVAWDPDNNSWFKWDVANNTFATENGHRLKWSLLDGQYQFSPF